MSHSNYPKIVTAAKNNKGLSIKDVRSQGERVVQFGHFANRGREVIQMRSPHFLVEKTSHFWNLC